MSTKTVRVMVDSLEDAAEALILVLTYAREHDDEFSFGGLSAALVLSSGLLLTGEIDGIVAELKELSGAEIYPE